MKQAEIFGIGRRMAVISVVSLLVTLVPSSVKPAAAQQDCRKISSFDVCGRFLQEWSKQNGEQNNTFVNGLPITSRHQEISLSDGKLYDVQWFERARYEAHPENQAPYDVLLGLLGQNLAEGRGSVDPNTKKVRNAADQPFVAVDKPKDTNGSTKVWFEQTHHTLAGKVLEYWNRYGGLPQFGYPLSEQFKEVSPTDGKLYDVQYFERNRFELHPEKQAPYDVELGLLGVQQFKTAAVPADQLPTAPAKNMSSTKDSAAIGFSQEPAGLQGWAQDSAVAQTVIDALDDGLVGQDYKGNYYPEDAYYVPTLENGGSYYVGSGDDRHLVTKYKLRRGILWSDGQELTSADAAFAYKLLLDPNSTVTDRTLWQKIASVDTPGKYTVIYNWLSYKQASDLLQKSPAGGNYDFLQAYVEAKQPVTDPAYFTVGAIFPRHVLQNIPADTISFSPYAHEGHIGTGPYKIERWVPSQELDLVRNSNYTLTAMPILKRIVIRFISDPNQMTGLLRAGELDGATSDAFPTPTETLDQLGGEQTVEYVPGRRWERADFDMKSPVTADRAVREAIITAVNRKKIVDDTLRGKGIVLNTVVPPASPLSLQNDEAARRWADKYKLPQYGYDPAKANALLDAAGWVRGADGVRAKNGQRLQLDYVTAGTNKLRESAAKQIQLDLKAVGIDAQVKKAASTCPDCAGQTCQLCAYASALGDDANFSEWSSLSAAADEAAKGRVLSYRRYSSPDLDPIVQAYSREAELTRRGELAAQIQTKLMQNVASLPLYVRPNIEVHKDSLANWHTSSGNTTPFYNVAQWYFK